MSTILVDTGLNSSCTAQEFVSYDYQIFSWSVKSYNPSLEDKQVHRILLTQKSYYEQEGIYHI